MKNIQKQIIHFILLSFMLCVNGSCKTKSAPVSVQKEPLQSKQDIPNYNLCYENTIVYLKSYEGFSSTPYRDVNGVWTIGYGHHMIDDYWRWKDTIQERAADSLLRKDLNKFIVKINSIHDINKYKTLALGLFAFNCGLGKYENSTLKRLVIANKPIDKEIIKWCHYRMDSVMCFDPKLLERREYELNIYNYGRVDQVD